MSRLKTMVIIGLLAFSIILLSAEATEMRIEDEIYELFIKDQMVDRTIKVLEGREADFLNSFFIKSLKKYKSKSYKKAFIEKLRKYYSKNEMENIRKLFSERLKAFDEIEKTGLDEKFYEFNTDLSMMIADIKDDGEEHSLKEKVLDSREQLKAARYKSCCANMLILSAAIEMYNLDHSPVITEISPNDYKSDGIFLKSNVITHPIRLPEKECEYYVFKISSASQPAEIRCRFHGERKANDKE